MSKVFEGLQFDPSKDVEEKATIEKVIGKQDKQHTFETTREPEGFSGKVSKKRQQASFDGPNYANTGNKGAHTAYGFDEHEQSVSDVSDEPEF